MTRNWTFGQKLAAGFATIILLVIILGAVSLYALQSVVAGKDLVINNDAQVLIDAETLGRLLEQKSAARFLLTGNDADLTRIQNARRDYLTLLAQIKDSSTVEDRSALSAIEQDEAEH